MALKDELQWLNQDGDHRERLRPYVTTKGAYLAPALKHHFPAFYQRVLDESPELEPPAAVYRYAFLGTYKETCECGNRLPFWSSSKGFRTYCGIGCSTSSEQRKARYEQTSLQRRGVRHPSQGAEMKEKIKRTNERRYGVPHSTAIPAVAAGRRRYMADEVAVGDARQKVDATNLQRYGVKTPLLLDHVKDRTREAHQQQWVERFFGQRLQALRETGITTQDQPILPTDLCTWTHTCGTTWQAPANDHPRCPRCRTRSKVEDRLLAALEGVDVTVGDRKALGGKEIDLLIGKVGIEVNGCYWHREGAPTLPLLDKTRLAEERGITLLHFWDFEVEQRLDAVADLIRSKIGLTERLPARKMTVDLDVSREEAIGFCQQHHLAGWARCSIRLGLRQQGRLVMLLTAGAPRFRNKHDLEIIRVCSAHGVTVVGGLSRLLKALSGLRPGASVLSYADRRLSTGNAYRQAGFTFDGFTQPGYFWTRGGVIIGRLKTQKAELARWLSGYDPSLTEKENLEQQGWVRCFDCGHGRWVTRLP